MRRSYARALPGARLASAPRLDTAGHRAAAGRPGAAGRRRARWPTSAPGRSRRWPARAGAREKLTETLRAWLLHHGRRDDVAAALFVHPQTVRYRMGQLRDLYGDRLEDPDTVLALTIALA